MKINFGECKKGLASVYVRGKIERRSGTEYYATLKFSKIDKDVMYDDIGILAIKVFNEFKGHLDIYRISDSWWKKAYKNWKGNYDMNVCFESKTPKKDLNDNEKEIFEKQLKKYEEKLNEYLFEK